MHYQNFWFPAELYCLRFLSTSGSTNLPQDTRATNKGYIDIEHFKQPEASLKHQIKWTENKRIRVSVCNQIFVVKGSRVYFNTGYTSCSFPVKYSSYRPNSFKRWEKESEENTSAPADLQNELHLPGLACIIEDLASIFNPNSESKPH